MRLTRLPPHGAVMAASRWLIPSVQAVASRRTFTALPARVASAAGGREWARSRFVVAGGRREISIEAADVRKGDILEWKGHKYMVSKVSDQLTNRKMFKNVEMKDLGTGNTIRETWRTGEKLQKHYVSSVKRQLLYIEANTAYLQDPETFEPSEIPVDLLGLAKHYLEDGDMIVVQISEEGDPVIVNPPSKFLVEVASSDPARDQKSSYKKCVLTNGRAVMVPGFIEPGQKIWVKLEEGELYAEKAS